MSHPPCLKKGENSPKTICYEKKRRIIGNFNDDGGMLSINMRFHKKMLFPLLFLLIIIHNNNNNSKASILVVFQYTVLAFYREIEFICCCCYIDSRNAFLTIVFEIEIKAIFL
ncbi:hypothetical protein ACKWTF_006067 [Chironomus riparius]